MSATAESAVLIWNGGIMIAALVAMFYFRMVRSEDSDASQLQENDPLADRLGRTPQWPFRLRLLVIVVLILVVEQLPMLLLHVKRAITRTEHQLVSALPTVVSVAVAISIIRSGCRTNRTDNAP